MLVNTRVLHGPPTGVQRYVSEVLAAWPGTPPKRVAPASIVARGIAGHAWEQCVLPVRLGRGQLLWSPVHSGPLACRNQVVTVHDVIPLDHPEWLNRRFARWYRFMLPRLARRARHLIAISDFTKKRLMATCDVEAERITVIANGVSDRFRPGQPGEIERVRSRLVPGRQRYVLAVGSLEPRKNLSRLLEAWQQALPDLDEDLVLVIAGAPGASSVFAESGPNRLPDRVVALGHVDDRDLPGLYAGAEWSLCVSLYEGFGLPPLESMACGTPVIVSDIPVFREVVGAAGLTVDPLESTSIAVQLRRALASPQLREEMSVKGLARSKPFSWQRTAQATSELLSRFA